MPTTKARINISVSKRLMHDIKMLAKRDQVPLATKARQLVEMMLMLEDDTYFRKMHHVRKKLWRNHKRILWNK